jgi:hypothetical protein
VREPNLSPRYCHITKGWGSVIQVARGVFYEFRSQCHCQLAMTYLCAWTSDSNRTAKHLTTARNCNWQQQPLVVNE